MSEKKKGQYYIVDHGSSVAVHAWPKHPEASGEMVAKYWDHIYGGSHAVAKAVAAAHAAKLNAKLGL